LEISWKIQKLVPRIPFGSGEAKGGWRGQSAPGGTFMGAALWAML